MAMPDDGSGSFAALLYHTLSISAQRGIAQLTEEEEIWVMMGGPDLRKPHVQRMEVLMRVWKLVDSSLL